MCQKVLGVSSRWSSTPAPSAPSHSGSAWGKPASQLCPSALHSSSVGSSGPAQLSSLPEHRAHTCDPMAALGRPGYSSTHSTSHSPGPARCLLLLHSSNPSPAPQLPPGHKTQTRAPILIQKALEPLSVSPAPSLHLGLSIPLRSLSQPQGHCSQGASAGNRTPCTVSPLRPQPLELSSEVTSSRDFSDPRKQVNGLVSGPTTPMFFCAVLPAPRWVSAQVHIAAPVQSPPVEWGMQPASATHEIAWALSPRGPAHRTAPWQASL